MKTIITACCLLLLLSFTLASCKKDKTSPSELIGEWTEMGSGDFNRILTFTQDQTFQFSVITKDGHVTTVTGSYKTEGNSLKVAAKEIQEYRSGQPPVKEPTSIRLFEDATFNISNNVLDLQYTTYPADAPLSTHAKFERKNDID